MTKDEAMKLALEALETLPAGSSYKTHNAASALRQALEQPQTPDDLLRQSEREGWRYAKECEAEVKRLRQALKQPEQEPVAWMYSVKGKTQIDFKRYPDDELVDNCIVTPLYTAPPKRQWVGLTDEEISEVLINSPASEHIRSNLFARAIETKLKEKNI